MTARKRASASRKPDGSKPAADAIRALARVFNVSDLAGLAPFLSSRVLYSSEWTEPESLSWQALLKMLAQQLEAVSKSGSMLVAELASVQRGTGRGSRPANCVHLTQKLPDGRFGKALCLLKMRSGKIQELALASVPEGPELQKTGIFPGLSELKDEVSRSMDELADSLLLGKDALREKSAIYAKFFELRDWVRDRDSIMRIYQGSERLPWMTPGRGDFEREEMDVIRKLDAGEISQDDAFARICSMMSKYHSAKK